VYVENTTRHICVFHQPSILIPGRPVLIKFKCTVKSSVNVRVTFLMLYLLQFICTKLGTHQKSVVFLEDWVLLKGLRKTDLI